MFLFMCPSFTDVTQCIANNVAYGCEYSCKCALNILIQVFFFSRIYLLFLTCVIHALMVHLLLQVVHFGGFYFRFLVKVSSVSARNK